MFKNWLYRKFPIVAALMWGLPLAESDEKEEEVKHVTGFFSTEEVIMAPRASALEIAQARTFQKTANDFKQTQTGVAMDSASSVKNIFALSQSTIPEAQLLWYSSQSFIGYQFCAMIAQHWLVDKACTMPARDAIRNGYETTVNDGSEINADIKEAILQADKRYRLTHHLVELVRMGRVFGIRIAMFVVESSHPDYYEKPFNIDAVKRGSYKGITQIDPYWVAPELDGQAAANPASMFFYEPTWWVINGKRYHRTHLIIMRTSEVPDLLKPSYIYGGVPVPQKIYERVYAAERTANEAPQLALTKRSNVIHVDVAQALANQGKFEQRMQQWAYFRDNYGIKILDHTETAEQFDTTLAELDAVIMTQYQIVAAAANVPAVKLLGTSPKGFNATGEFEEASYHEELESIQSHDLTPLIERHHLLLIKSEIAPQFNIEPFATQVKWNSLDSMTAKEEAELNKLKADTGAVLTASGAIDGNDERERIINDPRSGYSGISEADVTEGTLEDDPNESFNNFPTP